MTTSRPTARTGPGTARPAYTGNLHEVAQVLQDLESVVADHPAIDDPDFGPIWAGALDHIRVARTGVAEQCARLVDLIAGPDDEGP